MMLKIAHTNPHLKFQLKSFKHVEGIIKQGKLTILQSSIVSYEY